MPYNYSYNYNLFNEPISKESAIELIKESYCGTINNNIFLILSFVFIMWLFEPIVREYVKNHKDLKPFAKDILIFYKMIGLGFAFMSMYSLFVAYI